MDPKKIVAALVTAALAVSVGAVEAVVGDNSVVTVLVRTDSDGTYAYKERVVTELDPARSGGKRVSGAALPGETLVEIIAKSPCAGGNEARCLAGDERAKVSPCVRATGLDCFRKSPADKAPRFFGRDNVFPAAEASGAQCEPTPCAVLAGDAPKVAK